MSTLITVYVEDDEPFDITLDAFLADNADGIDASVATEIRFSVASNGIFIGGGGAAPAFCIHRAVAR
jgi:hypothetical protein